MRRSTLVLGLIGSVTLGVGFSAYWKATEHSRAWREFNSWVGADLSKVDQKAQDRIEGILATLIPSRKPHKFPFPFGHRPRSVWRLQAKNRPDRVVLFEVDDSSPHPGSTGIRLSTFSDNAKLLSVSDFTTGHRTYMSGFELKTVPFSHHPTLHVLTGWGARPGANFFGPTSDRQIYGLVDDHWLLIRIEEDGKAISTTYSIRHFRCGPELRPPSIEVVEKALKSSDPGEVLAMLCWLGAFHEAPAAGETSPQYQAASEAAFHAEASRNSSIIKRLEELRESPDCWIKEAATLALKK